jgi:hypothetical protein
VRLTFLPKADFNLSSKLLHDKDLEASLRTAEMLLPLVANGDLVTRPWAVMWQDHPGALATLAGYYAAESWARVSRDTRTRNSPAITRRREKAKARYMAIEKFRKEMVRPRRMIMLPDWFGVPEFHESHRSYLVRSRSDYYTFDVNPHLPLMWPEVDEEEF